MIDIIDTLTGTPCFWCGEPIGIGYGLIEFQIDQWEVICADCDTALTPEDYS